MRISYNPERVMADEALLAEYIVTNERVYPASEGAQQWEIWLDVTFTETASDRLRELAGLPDRHSLE